MSSMTLAVALIHDPTEKDSDPEWWPVGRRGQVERRERPITHLHHYTGAVRPPHLPGRQDGGQGLGDAGVIIGPLSIEIAVRVELFSSSALQLSRCLHYGFMPATNA